MTPKRKQEALRGPSARKERRASLLLAAAVMFLGSAAEPLYRPFDGPQLGVRALWCGSMAVIALALPCASHRRYAFLLPLAALLSCWLFAATVWLNGGVSSPDFQYIGLIPLVLMALFQDEVVACATSVFAALSAVAALSWLGDVPMSDAVDSLSTTAVKGVVVLLGTFSFRRVRMGGLATQLARTEALEQLALSEHRRAQTERLASLGQLAAGVAHEINNPLAAVSANVDILADEPALVCDGLTAPQTQRVISDLREGIGRMAQIVKDLKVFASGGSEQVVPCHVDEVIGDALRLASFKLGKAIEVRLSSESDLPEVTVNRRKLSQVLLNLLVSSADAMVDARTAKPWVMVAAARSDRAIQIVVQDNGPGIPAEIAAELFEPFVTTGPTAKGTGLGLALSREYVASFGGKLELQPCSAGARFSILLPAA